MFFEGDMKHRQTQEEHMKILVSTQASHFLAEIEKMENVQTASQISLDKFIEVNYTVTLIWLKPMS